MPAFLRISARRGEADARMSFKRTSYFGEQSSALEIVKLQLTRDIRRRLVAGRLKFHRPWHTIQPPTKWPALDFPRLGPGVLLPPARFVLSRRRDGRANC